VKVLYSAPETGTGADAVDWGLRPGAGAAEWVVLPLASAVDDVVRALRASNEALPHSARRMPDGSRVGFLWWW